MKRSFLPCMRLASLVLALVVLMSLVSACTTEADSSDADVIRFTDALGRVVTVEKNPGRTAALLGSFADVWLLSGGSLCAAAEDARSDFGLDLDDATDIGGAHSPSLELLLASAPDFVIASASTAAHVDMREVLEAAGITVAYFDVDNFAEYLGMLDICTEITGRKDLYAQNGLILGEQIEEIKSRYAGEMLPDEMRTVLLLRASSSTVKAKGSEGTILGEMLADMGCINIADSETALLEHLSVEAVIRAEPRHIFVVTMGSDSAAAKRSLDAVMTENPAWSTLAAVKAGRLHLMDKNLFNLKPNARWAEAYETLYDILIEE